MTEKNIKRRVYDVLSVLVALGLLRKEGKQITIRGSLKKRLAG
jgi:E2F/DP family winged-helix DNA-binding domain